MTDSRVPVLWITGPAGVGKSTVSWQIFNELAQAGGRVAFADADQLCMCYPAPPGDPTREVIKARNVGALVPRYPAAGADCVIVNGCLDPRRGLYADLMPRAEVTVCRLRAERDEVVRRYTGREGSADGPDDALDEAIKETLAEADAMDEAAFADVCVDTTGVAAGDVAERVRRRCADWPGFSGSALAGGTSESGVRAGDGDVGGSVLLICGAPGVGKSTIGFRLYVRCVRDGLTAGYVDLDQISVMRPPPDGDPGGHRLKAGNLAAMWRTYRDAGARHLIATGPADSDAALETYARAFPGTQVTVCRLHAGPAELTRRIMIRGQGGSWSQPGDPLRGKPEEYLRQVAGAAIAESVALEQAGIGTIRIDTDGITAAEAATLIAARTCPPAGPARPEGRNEGHGAVNGSGPSAP